MGDQATKTDIKGNNDDVIHAINNRLTHARQQEEYFFALEAKFAEKGYNHAIQLQISDSEEHRIAMDKYYAKSDFYFSKAHFYRRQVRRLEAKLSAELRRVDEAKSTPEPEILLGDVKGEEFFCEVQEDPIKDDAVIAVNSADPTSEFQDLAENFYVDEILTNELPYCAPALTFEGDRARAIEIDRKFTDHLRGRATFKSDRAGMKKEQVEGIDEEFGKDEGSILFNFEINFPSPTMPRSQVYSKYLFKWDGVFQTSEMNSGTSSFEEEVTDVGGNSNYLGIFYYFNCIFGINISRMIRIGFRVDLGKSY